MKMPFPVNYPEMVVKKSGGLTASENKLAILGYHTFLSLWSYPNPYKMQSNGKELCDLLIVYCKLVDCLEKCLICRHIRRFAD